MSICPICGMEYVDGITTCTECKVTLVSKDNFYKKACVAQVPTEAMADRLIEYFKYCEVRYPTKRFWPADNVWIVSCMEEDADKAIRNANVLIREEFTKNQTPYNGPYRSFRPMFADEKTGKPMHPTPDSVSSQAQLILPEYAGDEAVDVFTPKKGLYNELKSTASTFIIGSFVTLILAVILLIDVPHIPLAGASRYLMMTLFFIMSVLFIIIGFKARSRAKSVESEALSEDSKIRDILDSFREKHTLEDLEKTVASIQGENYNSGNEEDSVITQFQRLDLIRTYLIRENPSLKDEAFIDEMVDRLYTIFYENEEKEAK